jgi:hypothetical protein
MEKHFLADMMEGSPSFKAEPWYNPDGDCIVFKMVDEAPVADRIDEVLTVYNSAVDNRPIGYQIKGVNAIIRKFGLDGLAVSSQSDAQGVQSVSIVALLLAAYEDGPRTIGRRKAYALAMQYPLQKHSIALEELQAA